MKKLIATAAALGVAASLSGCPLPQQLAEYPKGQPVTPPRIVAESATVNAQPMASGGRWSGAIFLVRAGCSPLPVYSLTAKLVDDDTTELVTARWFVDYVADPSSPRAKPVANDQGQSSIDVPAPTQDPAQPNVFRDVPAFSFGPYGYGAAPGTVHTVELVVTNDPTWPGSDGALPYRSTSTTSTTTFETQVFRWVFQLLDPADPLAPPCD